MKKPFAYISYRRSDAIQAVRGLYVQLRTRLGGYQIFMDVATLTAGDIWPERLRRELDRATVLLLVVGPEWLTAADRYGRRRLDQKNDWVRLEACQAIAAGTAMIPVLVGGVSELPPAEALPRELHPILNHQVLALRDERWDDDVDRLAKTLINEHGFAEQERSVLLPQPVLRIEPLTQDELDAALLTLPGWEPVESAIARDYPNSRMELRKAYRFGSFKKAIAFMQAAVEPISTAKHHPRWENQWRTVIVYLSTWDIGHRISRLDVNMAHTLDELYEHGQARGDRAVE